jgi:hypothetical protein
MRIGRVQRAALSDVSDRHHAKIACWEGAICVVGSQRTTLGDLDDHGYAGSFGCKRHWFFCLGSGNSFYLLILEIPMTEVLAEAEHGDAACRRTESARML